MSTDDLLVLFGTGGALYLIFRWLKNNQPAASQQAAGPAVNSNSAWQQWSLPPSADASLWAGIPTSFPSYTDTVQSNQTGQEPTFAIDPTQSQPATSGIWT